MEVMMTPRGMAYQEYHSGNQRGHLLENGSRKDLQDQDRTVTLIEAVIPPIEVRQLASGRVSRKSFTKLRTLSFLRRAAVLHFATEKRIVDDRPRCCSESVSSIRVPPWVLITGVSVLLRPAFCTCRRSTISTWSNTHSFELVCRNLWLSIYAYIIAFMTRMMDDEYVPSTFCDNQRYTTGLKKTRTGYHLLQRVGNHHESRCYDTFHSDPTYLLDLD